MDAQDRLDGARVELPVAPGQARGDPRRLRPALELDDVLLAPPAVHRDDRHEAAAGHEADDEQPPLELRHQAGRIGPGGAPGFPYTPSR
jgi:hypothetical protein